MLPAKGDRRHRQSHIGNIVEEGSEEPVFDGPSEDQKRQYPDNRGNEPHSDYVDIRVHDCASLLSSSSLTGKANARTAAMITVRITALVPSGSSPMYGSLNAM